MAAIKSAVCMVWFVILFQATHSAIDCGTVGSDMKPCVPFLTGKGPLGNCCLGFKALYTTINNVKPDRQKACNCLKTFAATTPGFNYATAAALPRLCGGVRNPFVITPSTDCSKVEY